MMYKHLLALGLSTIAAIATSTAMADGLTLSSTGIADKIKVTCNGTTLSQEMNPNTTTPALPWWLVSVAFGSNTLSCHFNLDNASQDQIGTATLTLSSDDTQAQATNVQYDPKYLVTITPGQNVYASSMTVAIQNA